MCGKWGSEEGEGGLRAVGGEPSTGDLEWGEGRSVLAMHRGWGESRGHVTQGPGPPWHKAWPGQQFRPGVGVGWAWTPRPFSVWHCPPLTWCKGGGEHRCFPCLPHPSPLSICAYQHTGTFPQP